MSQNYKSTGVITGRMEKVRIQRKKRELRNIYSSLISLKINGFWYFGHRIPFEYRTFLRNETTAQLYKLHSVFPDGNSWKQIFENWKLCQKETGLKNTLRKKFFWLLYMDGVQSHQDYSHFEEAVYFLPLSSQKFLVLILLTKERWKADSTLEPPSGFEHGIFVLGIQRLNH